MHALERTRHVWLQVAAVLAGALSLAACGGSGGSGDSGPSGGDTASQICDPADSQTLDNCGSVYIGLTDADGDFLTYAVDVLSLTLERSNGAVVETLPLATRVDFAQYTDLTEFLTAATVPPGTYVGGQIRLD